MPDFILTNQIKLNNTGSPVNIILTLLNIIDMTSALDVLESILVLQTWPSINDLSDCMTLFIIYSRMLLVTQKLG